MKSKWGDWVNTKMDDIRDRKQKDQIWLRRDEPPFLGPGSCGSLTAGSHPMPQQDNFFAVLPYEIRREIFLYAFGDRRLHIDLSFDYPDVKRTSDPKNLAQKAVSSRTSAQPCGKRKIDRRKPKRWQWRGWVCRQATPQTHWMFYNDFKSSSDMYHGMALGPWEDKCRHGNGDVFHSRRGGSYLDNQIGIIGWLLSCRQAYQESIGILYSSNTFTMSSEFLISHSPKLLLLSHLSVISSLEITWPVRLLSLSQDLRDQKLGEDRIKKLTHLMETKFPSLRRLYISFHATDKQFWINRWVQADQILRHIDQLMQRLSKLVECGIALPDSVYESLISCFSSKRLEDRVWENYKVWRFVDGEMMLANPTPGSAYPEPPKSKINPTTGRPVQGYWVFEGASDGMSMVKTTMKKGRFVCGDDVR